MCVGEQMTLAATGGTGYLWSTGATTGIISVSPTVTTTYYVTVYGTCNAYDSVVVTVNPSPIVNASVSPLSIFMGDQAYLTATGAASFSWISLPPDPTLSGQSNMANPVVSPPVTTIYLVTGTDPNGCQSNDTVTLIVIPIFPMPDFISNIQSGCEPLLVQFFDQSTKVAPGADYFWDFGNGTTSTAQNPVAYFADRGKYDITLTITNPGGYVGSMTASQYIEVYPNPIARYIVSPSNDVSIFDPTVNFFDQSVGNPIHWYWTFGDSYYDTIQNPQHIYPDEDTATYPVMLIVTTVHGCTDTTQFNVVVRPEWALYIPTAFTPNKDGKNDYYFVTGFGIYEKDFEMTIYNRWGEMLYKSGDITKGWDGKVKGQYARPDTYIVKVLYKDFLQRKKEAQKAFTLIR
jgi:gliding motility-associated-like protein